MKESYDLSCCLVDRSKVAPFTAIANEAGPSQISFRRFASMLYGDDVVWLMWQEGVFFMKEAIFTCVTGAFTNQPAKFCWHIFAHSFLASLSRTYLGFHHSHQKLGLLVLIQFVLQIVIHLASAVQREKLRSALDDIGRRPKVQDLFISGAGTKQLSDLFEDLRCGFSCRHAGPSFESLVKLFGRGVTANSVHCFPDPPSELILNGSIIPVVAK